MFCPKCGASCGDNERFCPSCGAPLEQKAAAPAPGAAPSAAASPAASSGAKKAGLPVSPKVLGIAVAAIVVIVVLVNVVGGLFSGGGSFGSYSANAIQFIYVDGEYEVYAGTKKLDTVDNASSRLYSLDGSVAAFLEDDTLYVANSKGLTKVDEDVESFVLSPDGSVVAYTNDDYEVYYCKTSSGKGTKIGEGDKDVSLGMISPDGSAVVFTSYDKNGGWEGFLSKSGKSAESLGDDITPLAASNGGTYVYYLKAKDNTYSLYVMKNGKDEVRLEKEFSLYSALYLNSDGTQMLYQSGGNTYVSVKGAESTKLLSSTGYLLTPSHSAGAVSGYVAVSDFRGQCYLTSSLDVYYVDSKGESNKVVSSCDGVALSSNGKSLIYLKKGDLVKVNDVTNPNSKTVDLTDDGDIDSFVAKADLSVVYYCTDGDLYYQKGTGKAVRVGRDVYRFFLAADDSVCYIIDDDDMLYTSSGKDMTSVKELDDVYSASYVRGVCVFLQDVGGGERDVYVATGNSPKVLVKEASGVLS